MARKLTTYKSKFFFDNGIALLLLRWVGAGFLIYAHGFPKWMSIGHGHFQFLDPIGIGAMPSLILAAIAEGIAAFFVAIGWYTRPAALIVVIDLLVAFFTSFDITHLDQLALLYMVIFFTIFLLGPGKLSIDGLMMRNKSRKKGTIDKF